jgi:hypothetical protein
VETRTQECVSSHLTPGITFLLVEEGTNFRLHLGPADPLFEGAAYTWPGFDSSGETDLVAFERNPCPW